jgi:hypothetical protein
VTDHEIEQLLNRYRPADPPDDLLSSITRSPGYEFVKPSRTWPWAVAAAALLLMTIGLHVSAFVPSPEPMSTAQADLARQLGGDGLADRAAQFILVAQARRAANGDETPWGTR